MLFYSFLCISGQKDKNVETIKNAIIKSIWTETEEDVQEMAAYIIHIIYTNSQSHQFLADLIVALDQSSEQKENIKILVPFLVAKLIENIGCNKLNCAFLYLLCKKGLVSEKEIAKSIYTISFQDDSVEKPKTVFFLEPDKVDKELTQERLNSSFAWFFPEFLEIYSIPIEDVLLKVDSAHSNFISQYLPDKIDEFKTIRENDKSNLLPKKSTQQEKINIITFNQNNVDGFAGNALKSGLESNDFGSNTARFNWGCFTENDNSVNNTASSSLRNEAGNNLDGNIAEKSGDGNNAMNDGLGSNTTGFSLFDSAKNNNSANNTTSNTWGFSGFSGLGGFLRNETGNNLDGNIAEKSGDGNNAMNNGLESNTTSLSLFDSAKNNNSANITTSNTWGFDAIGSISLGGINLQSMNFNVLNNNIRSYEFLFCQKNNFKRLNDLNEEIVKAIITHQNSLLENKKFDFDESKYNLLLKDIFSSGNAQAFALFVEKGYIFSYF